MSINLSGPSVIHDQVCSWLAEFESLLDELHGKGKHIEHFQHIAVVVDYIAYRLVVSATTVFEKP